jgi:hypothetical protein
VRGGGGLSLVPGIVEFKTAYVDVLLCFVLQCSMRYCTDACWLSPQVADLSAPCVCVCMCADKRASQNKLDTDFGWFADAIHFGDYPAHIKVTKVGLGFKACLLSFSHASQPVLVGEATCQLWAWMVQLSTLLVHNRTQPPLNPPPPHTHTPATSLARYMPAVRSLHYIPSILPSFHPSVPLPPPPPPPSRPSTCPASQMLRRPC